MLMELLHFSREGLQYVSLSEANKMPGGLKSLTNHKIHVPKSRGVFFLRSPKRRRQLGHRCTLLGDPLGMMELCKYTIIWKN